MAISKKLKNKIESLTEDEQNRLVRMGWEDRTSFESIERQFDFTQNEFIQFMRYKLDRKTFERWRKRTAEHGHLKHEKTRGFKTTRFKCSRQSVDGLTKGWK